MANSIGIVKAEVKKLPLPEEGFKLEKGASLPELEVAFERYGNLSPEKDNVILVCHALSGDAHAAGFHTEDDSKAGWWDIMIGPGKGIDTNKFHVICCNVLGGCQGTTGPSSIDPGTGKPYGGSFPEITISDMVEAQKLLLEELGIEKLYGVIGGSAGGLQVLDWACRHPDRVKHAACVAAAGSLSAQALSFDIIARNIIMADPSWNKGHYYENGSPEKGLSLARMIGHITYLSKKSMDAKFGRERKKDAETGQFATDFQIESYLNYQGKSFVERFDANSFLYITAAMNSFALADEGEVLEDVFRKTSSRFLIVSVSSDWLYPEEQSLELVESILRAGKDVSLCRLDAPFGHDSFLIENQDLSGAINAFFSGPDSQHSTVPDQDLKKEYDVIEGFIGAAKSVIDLGCGDGMFLQRLFTEKGIKGHGIDIDIKSIIKCSSNGIPALQMDLDKGLGIIPDNMYDCAVLSRTLLEIHKPHAVLKEMLRIAGKGIVSFPNFASWKLRARLGFKGTLPMNKSLPYDWYDTPNIHFCTLKDFKAFCKENDIVITDILCVPLGLIGKLFISIGLPNLGADRVIVKIEKKKP